MEIYDPTDLSRTLKRAEIELERSEELLREVKARFERLEDLSRLLRPEDGRASKDLETLGEDLKVASMHLSEAIRAINRAMLHSLSTAMTSPWELYAKNTAARLVDGAEALTGFNVELYEKIRMAEIEVERALERLESALQSLGTIRRSILGRVKESGRIVAELDIGIIACIARARDALAHIKDLIRGMQKMGILPLSVQETRKGLFYIERRPPSVILPPEVSEEIRRAFEEAGVRL